MIHWIRKCGSAFGNKVAAWSSGMILALGSELELKLEYNIHMYARGPGFNSLLGPNIFFSFFSPSSVSHNHV